MVQDVFSPCIQCSWERLQKSNRSIDKDLDFWQTQSALATLTDYFPIFVSFHGFFPHNLDSHVSNQQTVEAIFCHIKEK